MKLLKICNAININNLSIKNIIKRKKLKVKSLTTNITSVSFFILSNAKKIILATKFLLIAVFLEIIVKIIVIINKNKKILI